MKQMNYGQLIVSSLQGCRTTSFTAAASDSYATRSFPSREQDQKDLFRNIGSGHNNSYRWMKEKEQLSRNSNHNSFSMAIIKQSTYLVYPVRDRPQRCAIIN